MLWGADGKWSGCGSLSDERILGIFTVFASLETHHEAAFQAPACWSLKKSVCVLFFVFFLFFFFFFPLFLLKSPVFEVLLINSSRPQAQQSWRGASSRWGSGLPPSSAAARPGVVLCPCTVLLPRSVPPCSLPSLCRRPPCPCAPWLGFISQGGTEPRAWQRSSPPRQPGRGWHRQERNQSSIPGPRSIIQREMASRECVSNVLLEPGAVTCQGLASIEGPLPDGSCCCRDVRTVEGTRTLSPAGACGGGGARAGCGCPCVPSSTCNSSLCSPFQQRCRHLGRPRAPAARGRRSAADPGQEAGKSLEP